MATEKDMKQTQELFDFLQGTVPEGYSIKEDHVPHLTPDQAWTVVWFLGNMDFQISDEIERCDVCGELFDTGYEGIYTEEGPPRFFCMSCQDQRLEDHDD